MMKSKTLETLFASFARPRILKLFIFNPETVFDLKTLAKKIVIKKNDAKKEINVLLNTDFLKKKVARSSEGKKVNGFVLNHNFQYLKPLRDFLIKVSPFTNESLVKKLNIIGRLKLVVISGVFMEDWESRIDLLVVADRIKNPAFNKIIKDIEVEMGREIKYALLDGEDFEYRIGVGDKLVRDIFDNPHQTILNRIGLVE